MSTPGGRLRVAGAGAILVFLAGFGALLCFWLAADWPTENGLFDYLSATIGDALLLPLIAAILIGTILVVPATRNDRRIGVVGGVVGFVAGATTQASWLADDSPNLNWTLPAPHEFNAPGWYHAVFLSIACGALLSLSLLAASRIRAARTGNPEVAVKLGSSPWLGVLFAAGLTMVGLLVADNRQAAETDAGLGTAVGVGVGVLVAIGLLIWTFGKTLHAGASNLAIGGATAIGATALALWGLAAPEEVAIVTLTAAPIVGLTLSIRPERLPSPGRGGAACLVLLGGSAASFQLVDPRGFEATIVVAITAATAVWIGGLGQRRATERSGTLDPRRSPDGLMFGFAVFLVFGVLAVATWLASGSPDKTEATLGVAASITVLDALVLTLVRDRFREFANRAQEEREHRDAPASPGTGGGAVRTWALLVGLAGPALAALGVLFAVAGPSMGVDEVAGGKPAGLQAWLAGDLVACALVVIAGALAFRRRKPPERFKPDLAPCMPIAPVTCCLLAAATMLTVALTQLGSPLHDPAAAAAVALAVGVLVGEDLVRSPVQLQLAAPSRRTVALAIAGGAMVAAGVFWLLTTGLWDGERPASGAGALMAFLLAIFPLALFAGGFGVTIAAGLRTKHLTEQPPWFTAVVQQLLYAGMILIAVAIPFFAAGRLEAHDDLANPGLVVLASMGFLPPLVAMVAWAMRENAHHADMEERHEFPLSGAEPRDDDASPEVIEAWGQALNLRRKAVLRAHVKFSNHLILGILAAGLLWLGAQAR